MRGAPASRRRTLACARRRLVAVAAMCLAPLVALTGRSAADPTPGPTAPDAPLPVTVTLDRLLPLAPQSGDTLRIGATLRDTSPTAVTDLSVRLEVSRTKVGSRGQFDSYADTVDGPPPSDAVNVASADVTLAHNKLAPGAGEPLAISVPVDDLLPPASTEPWQVYELAVVVAGQTPANTLQGTAATSGDVGRLRTFLPWAPLGRNGVGAPTQLAWVWPLVDRPHRAGDTTWTDDALAPELTRGGRLAGLVAAGLSAESQHQPAPPVRKPPKKGRRRPAPAKPQPPVNPVPVTWAVDPMLVDDATHMAAGYHVLVDGRRRAGTGQQAARAWLADVRTIAGTSQVLALPYADPDITAATRSQLTTEVQIAKRTGQTLLAGALGSAPLSYAWPPDGLLDQSTLNTLFAAGVTTVVLDSQALPIIGGEPSETPSAHTTVRGRDGNVDALLSDNVLTQVAQDGAANPTGGPLAIQRIISELLMIQAELPSDQRSLVIAPDRRWAPSQSYATALLAATGRVPWIEPVSLAETAATPVYTKAARASLAFPATERARQLSRNYLGGVTAIKRRIDAFAAILPFGDPQARAFDSGVLRLLSSAWRDNPALADVQRSALAAAVDATMGRVRIASRAGSVVTLTSHSGTVPVTITNELNTPVQIAIDIDAGKRLVVTGGRVIRTIAPHRQVPVDIRATAQTSGIFPLVVTLYTPTGQRYGARVQLFVRSTAYGATALLITGGATGVLLLTVALRLARRARAARRAARTLA